LKFEKLRHNWENCVYWLPLRSVPKSITQAMPTALSIKTRLTTIIEHMSPSSMARKYLIQNVQIGQNLGGRECCS
jgi:hypothetical protein